MAAAVSQVVDALRAARIDLSQQNAVGDTSRQGAPARSDEDELGRHGRGPAVIGVLDRHAPAPVLLAVEANNLAIVVNVKAELFGVLQLVEILVVEGLSLLGVVVAVGEGYPGGVVLLVVVEIGAQRLDALLGIAPVHGHVQGGLHARREAGRVRLVNEEGLVAG